MSSTGKASNWKNRPGFGALVLGVFITLISLAPLLLFYATPHENGIASDFGAQIGLAPLVFIGVTIGGITALVGLLRLVKRP